MTHAEYAYLLSLVDITRRAAEKAKEEGERFHHVGPFSTLSSGLQAKAWAEDGRMVLQLRHPTGDAERWSNAVALAFHAFFPGGFERSDPTRNAGWITHEGKTPCCTSS